MGGVEGEWLTYMSTRGGVEGGLAPDRAPTGITIYGIPTAKWSYERGRAWATGRARASLGHGSSIAHHAHLMVLFGGANPKNMQVVKGGCGAHSSRTDATDAQSDRR